MAYLTRPMLVDAATAIIATVRSYKSRGAPRNERALDPVLFAYLLGRGLKVKRQAEVQVRGQRLRIDFYTKGFNPAVVEWAVRPPRGGQQLGAIQNRSEIQKLSRIPSNKRRLVGRTKYSSRSRYLLLVDLTPARLVLNKDDLEGNYKQVTLGPGRYVRENVTVLYVHETDNFSFRWKAK